jgi:flagellar biosynthesis regulator FlaF
MAQNKVAAANFRRKGNFDRSMALPAIPAAVGAIVGSKIEGLHFRRGF